MIKFAGRAADRRRHRYGVLTFADVIVKSSNVGAIKVGLKLGPERLGLYVNRFGFGKRRLAGLSGREPRHRLGSEPSQRQRPGLDLDGLPGRRHAAADGGGGQRGRQRRPAAAAARRAGGGADGMRTPVVPAEVGRADHGPHRRRADHDHGGRRRSRHRHARRASPASPWPARRARRGKIVNGAYSKSDYNVSFVGFVPSRKPVFTAIVVVDTPRAGKYYGGTRRRADLPRIADAALRHLGVPPTVFPAPPVLVDRKAQRDGGRRAARR